MLKTRSYISTLSFVLPASMNPELFHTKHFVKNKFKNAQPVLVWNHPSVTPGSLLHVGERTPWVKPSQQPSASSGSLLNSYFRRGWPRGVRTDTFHYGKVEIHLLQERAGGMPCSGEEGPQKTPVNLPVSAKKLPLNDRFQMFWFICASDSAML